MKIRFGRQLAALVGITVKLLWLYAGYFSFGVILYWKSWTLGFISSKHFTCEKPYANIPDLQRKSSKQLTHCNRCYRAIADLIFKN